MAANSGILKGWAVTLVAAIFALGAEDSDQRLIVIAIVPVLMFWLLDAFYLRQERRFRDLYGIVRQKSDEEIDFAMETPTDQQAAFGAFVDPVNSVFYGILLAVVAILTYLLLNS
ncbi:hypothetical protein [Rhodopirellula bahusiensis]